LKGESRYPLGCFYVHGVKSLLSALDVEAEEVVKTAFGTNLPRLAAIKRKYDPTNFFCVNQNIAPGIESAA